MGCIGHEVAILVKNVDRDEREVFAVSLQSLDFCSQVSGKLEAGGFACCAHCLCAHLLAVLVVYDDLHFSWLVFDIVPSESVAVDARIVFVSDASALFVDGRLV